MCSLNNADSPKISQAVQVPCAPKAFQAATGIAGKACLDGVVEKCWALGALVTWPTPLAHHSKHKQNKKSGNKGAKFMIAGERPTHSHCRVAWSEQTVTK